LLKKRLRKTMSRYTLRQEKLLRGLGQETDILELGARLLSSQKLTLFSILHKDGQLRVL
jgi:hypothetical protein